LKHHCDLAKGGTGLIHRFRSAAIKDDTLPTELLPAMLGALDASPDTLSDQFPFKFRHSG
jgi:hypothetical protein